TADLSTETRVLARHDSGVVEVSERFLQLYWIGDLGGCDAARLLGSFTSDPPPALGPLVRGKSKMLFSAPRNHGDDRGDVQFRALLDRPLHAIEFEDGEQQGDGNSLAGRDFFTQGELHSLVLHAGNGGPPDLLAASDFELLADARAQGARQVCGVRAGQGGAIAGELVGNPAASGHGVISNKA